MEARRVLLACCSFLGVVAVQREQKAVAILADGVEGYASANEPCVMQNLITKSCYEGSEGYLRKCVRRGVPVNRNVADSAIVFSKKSDGTCKALGYNASLHEFSSVIYGDVEAYTIPQNYATAAPYLRYWIHHPEAVKMTVAEGYPAGCSYFGKVI
mmetsp:Transcript_95007/g.295764  ORF Transcript_95007/g.295764 Transcript_95007/m.295764 type:complete len:156 (-) Transcript_95007:136-603(-)|eukprot:CAMPEP_0204591880 /NCGR_PEP_ID=MMETSP0661-20131031/50620_1 /ASSEMBLY_ACC=CAM_ASM_000606 /TAXON_ID=109239 /ORGANISM="Alexandrium margalefi, Strain AMGDE01CS-322" /LENGTH=155 /DNA_ID=CAMNT_0051602047 /DNA_START=47 /DNA_END=514 /DNA_ORIENTATION=+